MSIENQLTNIENKLDELLQLMRPLSQLLVRSNFAAKQLDLNKNTLSQNKKISRYEEVGSRRTYVEIGEVAVVKKRKKRR